MADSKPQTPLNPPIPLNINNPRRKHYHHYTIFMYKAALVTVFLVLLPLFPSIAPEFINQTLHARSWELLQLILVGIAVSYGLFSKKNDNDEVAEKPTDHKPDALSYASKLLQVSSVFDEDEADDHTEENNKVLQTLNSQQYYRKQPVVVVAAPAQQSPKKGNIFVSNACEFTQKPLLLPVRSLRQPSEGEDVPPSVLRSPVPWRSRSGRVEMVDQSTTTLPSQPDTDDVAAKEESFVEKAVVMETSSDDDDDDDDDDDEGDYFEGTISSGNNNNNNSNVDEDDHDVGRDVDKKADEFIAKFREQIRLQRIESIRRTTDQRRAAGKASRSN